MFHILVLNVKGLIFAHKAQMPFSTEHTMRLILSMALQIFSHEPNYWTISNSDPMMGLDDKKSWDHQNDYYSFQDKHECLNQIYDKPFGALFPFTVTVFLPFAYIIMNLQTFLLATLHNFTVLAKDGPLILAVNTLNH